MRLRHAAWAVLPLLVGASELRAQSLEEGVQLVEQGKFAEAEALLRGVEGVGARAWLARALAKQKKWEEGQAVAKQALADAPFDPVASSALGQSLVGLKRYDEAIQRLGATIAAREEQDTRAEGALDYFWRGMAWSGKRETARMAVDFETFVHWAPSAPEAETVKRMLGAIR